MGEKRMFRWLFFSTVVHMSFAPSILYGLFVDATKHRGKLMIKILNYILIIRYTFTEIFPFSLSPRSLRVIGIRSSSTPLSIYSKSYKALFGVIGA